nr:MULTISPECIES: glycosyltransferase family 4 protein [unclassified Ectothiorhodospira]
MTRRFTQRFEVHVLAPHASGAAKREEMAGLTIHRFQYAPERWQTLTYEGGILARLRQNRWRAALVPVFLVAEALAIRRLLKRHDFAAIHSHWIIPQTLALRLGTLGLTHTPPTLCISHGGDLFGLQGRVMRELKRWALHRCSAITVVSQAMVPEAKRLAPHMKPQVIPMGTCLSMQFTPDSDTAREPGMVLFVGRLVEKKGVKHLLEAAAQLLPQHPNLHLYVAGKGPDETALKERARQVDLAGHVTFLGGMPQARLPELYRRASVTIVPSVVAEGGDQEGFGLVIVEAMGCGCPVIVSDLPAIEDILSHEDMALRVPPGDVDALAKALDRTLNDPLAAGQRAEKALVHVRRRFGWESIGERYLALLYPPR